MRVRVTIGVGGNPVRFEFGQGLGSLFGFELEVSRARTVLQSPVTKANSVLMSGESDHSEYSEDISGAGRMDGLMCKWDRRRVGGHRRVF